MSIKIKDLDANPKYVTALLRCKFSLFLTAAPSIGIVSMSVCLSYSLNVKSVSLWSGLVRYGLARSGMVWLGQVWSG